MWLVLAGLSGFLAVLAGAMGDHAIAMNPQSYHIYQIANHYQFYHTLLLMVIGYLALKTIGPAQILARISGTLLVIGLLFFPGSLYINALYHDKSILVLAPIGGFCFMLAWLMVAVLGMILWKQQSGEEKCKQRNN